jgi:hypothetical protein
MRAARAPDGQVAVEVLLLRHVPGHRAAPARRPPVDGDRARRQRQQAEQHLQQRGLARAVRAEDGQALPGCDVEIEAPPDHMVAEPQRRSAPPLPRYCRSPPASQRVQQGPRLGQLPGLVTPNPRHGPPTRTPLVTYRYADFDESLDHRLGQRVRGGLNPTINSAGQAASAEDLVGGIVEALMLAESAADRPG